MNLGSRSKAKHNPSENFNLSNFNRTMADCIKVLKQWTGKATATVIYDNIVDEFTHDGLFNKAKGKPNVAVVGFTTDGDVFGGFYSVAVTKQDEDFKDPIIFAFSFESHGRCETPQRFVLKKWQMGWASVFFWKNNKYGFVWFGATGGGDFCLGNESSNSFCCAVSRAFKGLKNTTLTGKNGTWYEGPFHHCIRLVVVRLE